VSSELADGFYEISPNGTGAPVKVYDRIYRTGSKLNLSILKTEVRSYNNANSQFQLWVTIPYDQNPQTGMALFVDGIAYRSYGYGGDQRTATWEFHIDGRENADRVANLFGAKPILRRHPHHELEISINPTSDEFSVGQRVSVIFHIRNIGGLTISFQGGGRSRAARDNQYTFVCSLYGKQVEDIGNSGNLGGLLGRIDLKPGEFFEKEIDLGKWFAFDKPGTYELLGSYYMPFLNPEENIDVFPIWTDYATAEFLIKIR
jgi:hypothetical protein